MRRDISPSTSCRDNSVSMATTSAGFSEAGAVLPGGSGWVCVFIAAATSSSPVLLSPVAGRVTIFFWYMRDKPTILNTWTTVGVWNST